MKTAFQKEFLVPAENIFNQNIISKPTNKYTKNKQRNQILKQGRANFDMASDGLTPSQKVDLYCYHYFQMHFTSSYVFFQREKELILDLLAHDELYFVDIGCGPMTSGLAFSYWISQFAPDSENANYIGMDISSNMINKADQIVLADNFDLRFRTIHLLTDKNKARTSLEDICDENPQALIINYSFLFASESLNVPDFIDFTTELHDAYPETFIFYQNPTLPDLNTKWNKYKNKLQYFKSKELYPTNIRYKFDDVLGSSNYPNPTLNAKFDLLKSYRK